MADSGGTYTLQMHNHLKSAKHSTTLKIREKNLLASKMKAPPSTVSLGSTSAKKQKVQSSITSFATKVEIPVHLRMEYQELMAIKFIAANLLPFPL